MTAQQAAVRTRTAAITIETALVLYRARQTHLASLMLNRQRETRERVCVSAVRASVCVLSRILTCATALVSLALAMEEQPEHHDQQQDEAAEGQDDQEPPLLIEGRLQLGCRTHIRGAGST